MKRNYTLYVIRYTLFLSGLLFLSGCVVRTYSVTRERVDQDLSGNRGYLKGEAPYSQEKERKLTRTSQVVEVEFHPPVKFVRMPSRTEIKEETAKEEKTEDRDIWGNRGYISETKITETGEAIPAMPPVEKYTVQKGDTLQKISKKFYGTTKKWNKIYEANKDVLKAPDKIYPGQVIDVPVEPLKEPVENLK